MKNIFYNAYFGKTYKTRDGRKAIYQQSYGDRHILMLKDEGELIVYLSNGNVIYEYSEKVGRVQQGDDIISEWSEEISEEELGSKYVEFYNSDEFRSTDTPYFYFSAGYRKALKQ